MNDRTLGIAALALAAFMTWAGWDIEAPFAYEPVGPRAFPLLLALIIGLCGLRLAIKGGNPVQANAPGANGRIALMVLFCAGYAFLFQWLAYRRHRVDDGGGGSAVRRRLGQVRHRGVVMSVFFSCCSTRCWTWSCPVDCWRT